MYFINSNEEETHQSATVPTEPEFDGGPLRLLAAESLPAPGRGIGNPTAEEHVDTIETRLRGEGRRRARLR